MLSKLRPRSAYDVIALLALVVGLIGTGSAIAAIVVSSNSQVARGTISGHKPPSGKHPNIIAGSINGKDIADHSGVDTCSWPLTRYGAICVGIGAEHTFYNAADYCAKYDLRLPSVTEASTLAQNYDVPGVTDADVFWTDLFWKDGNADFARVVSESGAVTARAYNSTARTVCVTNPTA